VKISSQVLSALIELMYMLGMNGNENVKYGLFEFRHTCTV